MAESGVGLILGIFGFIILFYFLIFAIAIASFIFWIIMLVDVIRREFPKEDEKIVWILIVVLTGIIGALIYYFMIKRKESRSVGRKRKK